MFATAKPEVTARHPWARAVSCRRRSSSSPDLREAIVVEPADPSAHQQSITMQQVDIYGETWADRLGRLLRAYNLSQAKLASVIGLSAPMLSQLISGQRVKISN